MGKIITVVPTSVGAGGKFMATSIAHGLRNKYNDSRTKIALVDFDLHNPVLALSLTSDAIASARDLRGLDSLLEKINSNTLNDRLFIDNMIKIESQFDVLKGTRMPERYDSFNRSQIEDILGRLKAVYDFVVIAVSPEIDNACTVYSLVHADEIVMVSRLNFESYSHFDKTVENIKQCKINKNKKIKIVYNYRTGQYDLSFDKKIFNNQDDVEVIGDMKYYPYAIDNQNIKPGVLGKLAKLNGDYNKQISVIINGILEENKK